MSTVRSQTISLRRMIYMNRFSKQFRLHMGVLYRDDDGDYRKKDSHHAGTIVVQIHIFGRICR